MVRSQTLDLGKQSGNSAGVKLAKQAEPGMEFPGEYQWAKLGQINQAHTSAIHQCLVSWV